MNHPASDTTRRMSVGGSKDSAVQADGGSVWTGGPTAAPAALELPRNASAEPAFSREPGSYRDRNSAVFYHNGEILRGISAKALANWQRLAATRFFADFTTRGNIVPTEMVSEPSWGKPDQVWAAVLKHEVIPFVSYPYEWTFGMLKDAALLHLDLMLAALKEDFILKDSSPYNVQWHGARPVFIDIPSFEVLEPGQPWVGYRQFCELFLYPLMLRAYKGVDFRPWLRGSIDGISAASLRPLLSLRDLARAGVVTHVVAHNALQRRYSARERNVRSELTRAGFDKRLIVRNVLNLRKIISRMVPGGGKTEWSDYTRTHSYGEADFDAKRTFVRNAASLHRWRRVWDLGCNTGTFSRIAAEHADHVVAMDGDWMAVEDLYQSQKARSDGGSILPLVVNLADPSPGQGWRGRERKSLPDRGTPDLTLCLALIHHVVIGANIPMADFMRWLADLGTALVIEFIDREDEMVEALLRHKDDQYDDYRPEVFQALLKEHFDVRNSETLKGRKRSIHFALPRDSAS
jgi:SAM-dependent methyltransferase